MKHSSQEALPSITSIIVGLGLEALPSAKAGAALRAQYSGGDW
jgi:hypothetical protein